MCMEHSPSVCGDNSVHVYAMKYRNFHTRPKMLSVNLQFFNVFGQKYPQKRHVHCGIMESWDPGPFGQQNVGSTPPSLEKVDRNGFGSPLVYLYNKPLYAFH